MTGWPDASTLFGWMFAVTFLGVACWEAWQPSRMAVAPLTLRWFGNIALFAMALLMTWLVPLLSSLGAATLAAKHGWGFFHLVAPAPAIALAASFVLLDFFGYWTHRLLHKIPLLWRLHALHHSDSDLDVTTTIRHHPAEALVQALCDAALALLFGFSPQAVLLYGGVVLVVQTFHHGNVMLPARLRPLSRLLITPDLHRLHHSKRYAENNSNFGNLVPLWDRLFGTLRKEPEDEFQVGLPEFTGADFQRLDKLLIQPLRITAAPPPRAQARPKSTFP
ncbi:MAG TPA: sterol desaturase family protein [Rhizomicrobium sp.]|nr:sterol desaturase family protein [Rhizomicrobium sp.]